MKIETGQTYSRKDPGGRTTIIDVRNQDQANYHQSLVEKGYEYELLAVAKA